MRKIVILLILILSVLAVSFAFAGDTEPTMTVTANDISSGDVAVISISLPSDAQGKVTVSVDGKNYEANIINGHAVVNIEGLNTGQYNIRVTYDGDDQYAPISKDVSLTVKESSNTSDINASGEPDVNSINSTSNSNTTSPNNTTNTTNTTNNTNHTQPPQPPRREPPKPPVPLANTGIPILVLVVVVIALVFTTVIRRK